MKTKKHSFDSDDQKASEYAKALSHPARIRILKILSQKSDCMVGDIATEVPELSRSTVSQHLKELKISGLIQGEIDGPKICYCIQEESFEEMKVLFRNLWEFLSNSQCKPSDRMKTDEQLKELVKQKYSQIAEQSKELNQTSCCGQGSCEPMDYTIFAENYEHLDGYSSDADLGLGCGLPTSYAKIRKGDTVLDLGSGAGNDCFVARALTGAEGKVIGVDMTEAMIEKARNNAENLGINNIEFRLGDIEKLPIGPNRIDVVISNCVLNLVPNKEKAFEETYRVLKPGGHFSISDVVIKGHLPEGLLKEAEMYAGCVSGALPLDTYTEIIHNTGFCNVEIQKLQAISLPDAILLNYISEDEITSWKNSDSGIYSLSIYAEKPQSSCTPGSNCC